MCLFPLDILPNLLLMVWTWKLGLRMLHQQFQYFNKVEKTKVKSVRHSEKMLQNNSNSLKIGKEQLILHYLAITDGARTDKAVLGWEKCETHQKEWNGRKRTTDKREGRIPGLFYFQRSMSELHSFRWSAWFLSALSHFTRDESATWARRNGAKR